MSHSRNVGHKKNITAASLKVLEAIPVGNNNLMRELDNSAQSVYVSFMPNHDEAREKLGQISRDSGKEFSDGEITQAMGKIFDTHNDVLAVAGNRKRSVPAQDFHRFYSLVYHLIPESRGRNGQTAIEKSFEALKLSPPLGKDEVSRELHGILALSEKHTGWSKA